MPVYDAARGEDFGATVRKVVAVATELGREIATPAEAKAIMGIGAAAKPPRAAKEAQSSVRLSPTPTS
jgi:hypothetical protein